MSFTLALSRRAASVDLRAKAKRLLEATALAYSAPELIALALGQEREGYPRPSFNESALAPALALVER